MQGERVRGAAEDGELDDAALAGVAGGAGPSMPGVPNPGDVTRLLANAMIEQAAHQREEALAARTQARQQAQEQLTAQAGEMKAAADRMMAGAVSQLVMSTVDAGMMVGGVMKGAGAPDLPKPSQHAPSEDKSAAMEAKLAALKGRP